MVYRSVSPKSGLSPARDLRKLLALKQALIKTLYAEALAVAISLYLNLLLSTKWVRIWAVVKNTFLAEACPMKHLRARIMSNFKKLSKNRQERYFCMGRGGSLVVSPLAYCSKDPSLNPAGY